MKLKEVGTKIILALSSIWVYVPIIAGIITPMIYMIPLAYTSWVLFFSLGHASWANMLYGFGFKGKYLPLGILLTVFEIAAFIGGLTLFVWGFIHIAQAKKNNVHLAQTGPYKYIRHPQHFGIILISLPFVFLVRSSFNFSISIRIRAGDIISWVLFCLILIIWSDIEERKMRKKYPEEFANYKNSTGFFFPKIGDKETLTIQKKKRYYYLIRYLIFFIFYCIVVLIMFLVTKYVPGTVSR